MTNAVASPKDDHVVPPEIEKELRREWWLSHGCSIVALYGDDGEMHCGECGIDFLRWAPHEISARLANHHRSARNAQITPEMAQEILEVALPFGGKDFSNATIETLRRIADSATPEAK